MVRCSEKFSEVYARPAPEGDRRRARAHGNIYGKAVTAGAPISARAWERRLPGVASPFPIPQSNRSLRMSKSPGHQKWPNHQVREERVAEPMKVTVGADVIAQSNDVIRVVEDGAPPRYY